MQSFSNEPRRHLNKDASLAKAREMLEQIPEDAIELYFVEKRTILQAFILAEGNRAAAARMLGVSKRSVFNKLKRYKL